MSETPTATELAEETSTWLVGGGVITLALFPLALPLIALLVISVLPLLIPVVAVAVLVAVVALPVALVRTVVRRASRALRSERSTGAVRHSGPGALRST